MAKVQSFPEPVHNRILASLPRGFTGICYPVWSGCL